MIDLSKKVALLLLDRPAASLKKPHVLLPSVR
jgi:hypothetical protein